MRRMRVNTVYPSPWAVPFMGRTASAALNISNQSNVTISGKQFQSIGSDVSSIRITNCQNVLITACDFKDDCQPITVYDSTNVEISWCRYQNITGPSARNGSNRGNFTQWVNTFGGSIHDNKGVGGDTEDIVSIFQSGGNDAAHPLIIERNWFEGTTWTSGSGSGMLLADGGGSHIVVRNNILLNPGAVGIGIASGTDIHVTDNTVYGEQRTGSNIGVYVWNQSTGVTCSGHEVARNTATWFAADGTQNPAWDAGNCGSITGLATNNWFAGLDPATLHVTL